ncbi:metalloprotease protein [Fusarium austroafricanum]|uniref:Metalloprotease protein n=1 Tax=Fusarium austroafricanum TaxID=2364996 RepID=A0A8H4NUV5_9HYPO|nr:metalloprotease protein [Fusarium austroafricanum]
MSNIRQCTIMPVPSELRAQADTLALQENSKNGHQLTAGGEILGANNPPALALPVGSMWRSNRVLRVKLLNGSDKVKRKIQEYAVKWNEFSGVTFEFVDSDDAEIRVNCDDSDRSWSYVGTDCLSVAKDRPTMNFGWLNDSTQDSEYSRVVIHEFGHALGCGHEHQSPAGGIPWNKEAAYNYYMATNNWTREDVERNIFDYYSFTMSRISDLDTKSIMIYPIPKSLTTNGFFTDWNNQLSDDDKKFISGVYPKGGSPSSAPNTGAAVASFNTMEVRPWDKPQLQNSRRVAYSKNFDKPPKVAVGLNWLDIGNNANIRIDASADPIGPDSAVFQLNAWADTTLYSAGCVGLEVVQDDPDFQMGKFSTTDDHPWNRPQEKTSRRINFDRPFSSPPKVVIWLSQLDMDKNKNWRVDATATNITPTGFTLNLNTWADTILYAASANWVAYPSNKANVTSGRFSITDVRPWSKPQLQNTGRVSFPSGTFSNPPLILIGLNNLDIDYHQNLRIKLGADNISAGGMNWRIDSWFDTTLYSAGGSYIALA